MMLTEDKIEEIYIELREGTILQKIALMFDVSYATIQHINDGKQQRVDGFKYPIVERRKKYATEPNVQDPFWDSYIEPPLNHV